MSFTTKNIRQSQAKKARKQKVQRIATKTLSFGKKLKTGAQKTIRFAESGFQKFRDHQKRKRRMRWLIGAMGIVLGVFVIFEAGVRVVSFVDNFGLEDVLEFAGAELPVDEYGMTNILLLGIGGDNHSGGTLTDSIIIASIDDASKSVSLLSIPRDFYITTSLTSGRINSVIRDVMSGFGRGQQEEGFRVGVDVLREELQEVFGIKIHRFVQVDFSAVEQGIDAIGGIEVEVEKTIDDTLYPDKNYGYERFFLPAGQQQLNGATALKYARSRHGSSDFDRSRRQQKLLQAIQEKAVSAEILTSPTRLKELYSLVEQNIKTDIQWREIISLGHIGYSFPRENILSFGLNNDETKPGGFLVTPDRELYGGAFVLVPFLNLTGDKYARIRIFAHNIFRERALELGTVKIHVLNGSNITGLAGKTATYFERFGIPVHNVDNSELNITTTRIEYVETPASESVAQLLERYGNGELFPVAPIPQISEGTPAEKVTVIVGQQHQNFRIPALPQTPVITELNTGENDSTSPDQ